LAFLDAAACATQSPCISALILASGRSAIGAFLFGFWETMEKSFAGERKAAPMVLYAGKPAGNFVAASYTL
ncbi:MAG: hypothetical protein IKE64_12960, partial [Thermoguttaceae bacterium]|nr:hypothetical protein [Thermoguttaceae bacterium]